MEASTFATGRHRRALVLTLVVTLAFMVVEVVGGILTNSLMLLADAAHMLTDAAGLALALFALWIAQRPATPRKTYGYLRAEIFAAMINSLVLLGLALVILWEAYSRWFEPEHVDAGPMLVIAVIGLGVNLFGIWNLHGGAEESLNVHGAFLEVLTDALGSVATIVAGTVIYFTGWTRIDSLLSGTLGLFILPRTINLLSQSVHILLEGTPARLDLTEMESAVRETPGVKSVHDLHVWTITSGLDAASLHVVLADDAAGEAAFDIVDQITALLKERFQVSHVTIQVERHDRSGREIAP